MTASCTSAATSAATSEPIPDQPTDRLAVLVRTHQSALMAYALRVTNGDRAWAEEVVQDTFVRAWRQLDRMTEEFGSVRSWLLRVAHNLAVDGHRSRRPMPTRPENFEPLLEPAEDGSNGVLDSIQLDQLLATLASQHRAALVEVYVRDQPMAVAAQHLGVPVGTVKSRVFYALRQLRAETAARWI